MISAFGIEHGEISKFRDKTEHPVRRGYLGGQAVGAGVAGAGFGGVMAYGRRANPNLFKTPIALEGGGSMKARTAALAGTAGAAVVGGALGGGAGAAGGAGLAGGRKVKRKFKPK